MREMKIIRKAWASDQKITILVTVEFFERSWWMRRTKTWISKYEGSGTVWHNSQTGYMARGDLEALLIRNGWLFERGR